MKKRTVERDEIAVLVFRAFAPDSAIAEIGYFSFQFFNPFFEWGESSGDAVINTKTGRPIMSASRRKRTCCEHHVLLWAKSGQPPKTCVGH